MTNSKITVAPASSSSKKPPKTEKKVVPESSNSKKPPETEKKGFEVRWEVFLKRSKQKADVHAKTARFWSAVDAVLGSALILTSALTAMLASITAIPSWVVVVIGFLGTVLASMNSFLKPARKQNLHHTVSRNLRSLRFQMVCCETEERYKKLLDDYTEQLSEEPLCPKRFAQTLTDDGNDNQQLKMSSKLYQALNMAK